MQWYHYFFSFALASMASVLAEDPSFAVNYYQLESLLHALYGEYHPFRQHLSAYRNAIAKYTSLDSAANREAIHNDPATETVINELKNQLETIKAQAGQLLSLYTVAATTPIDTSAPLNIITTPPTYTATPTAPSLANPALTDTALAQLVSALENLQSTQTAGSQPARSTLLRDQVILFLSGIAILGALTYGLHHRLSSNSRELKAWAAQREWQLNAPHTDTHAGVLTELRCIHAHMQRKANQ